MGKACNLTAQVFGRLTVVFRAENNKRGDARWHCRCECGTEKVVQAWLLKSGHTKSCGCFNREVTAERHKNPEFQAKFLRAKVKHGHTPRDDNGKKAPSPTYKSWRNLKKRCNNPNHTDYKDYGGRGIAVCERWSDFRNFLEDMGERPEGKTIDRKDNDGGYYKENCRWATAKEQRLNQRPRKERVLV